MTQEQVKVLLSRLIEEMDMQCGIISERFDTSAISGFRANAKNIRSFMQLIRLHQGRTAVETPAKFKKLYMLAAVMQDSQNELLEMMANEVLTLAKNTKLNEVIAEAQAEWRRTYAKNIMEKLGKMLLSHNYDNIPPAIFNNFFSRIANSSSPDAKEKEVTAGEQ